MPYRSKLGFRRYPKGARRFAIMRSRLIFRKLRRISRTRRMMTRRRTKPELKWTTQSNVGQQIPPQNWFYDRLTPQTIAHGAARNQRIGNKIKTMRLAIRLYLSTTGDGTKDMVYPVRIVIFTLRDGIEVDMVNATYTDLNNEIGASFVANQFFDFNCFTILMDRTIFMSNSLGLSNTQHTATGGGNNIGVFLKKYFRHPRTVTFSDTTNQNILKDPKDHMWLAVFNNGPTTTAPTVKLVYAARMTYIDV